MRQKKRKTMSARIVIPKEIWNVIASPRFTHDECPAETTERKLDDQKRHDEPVKYLRGRSIVQLFGHDVPCFQLLDVSSPCEAPVRRAGVPYPGSQKWQSFSATFSSIPDEVALVRKNSSISCDSIDFGWNRAVCSGKANADFKAQLPMPGCCPLTLLLCFIEAIEVTFSRHAPWIFLSVNRLWGQRSSEAKCDRRKGQKSCTANSAQE